MWDKISEAIAKPINKLNRKMEAYIEQEEKVGKEPPSFKDPVTPWEFIKEKLNSLCIFNKKRK